jgi:hypothetical protein
VVVVTPFYSLRLKINITPENIKRLNSVKVRKEDNSAYFYRKLQVP